MASLRTFLIPLREDGLADLKAVPEGVWREARVLLLNYPNNPTGAVADWGYFEEALGLARKHGLWLVHDNPYVDQVYEGEAPSPLALPGAKERVVELFSLSKGYNLAGFRLGFALGSEEALARLERVKGVVDFNQYAGILRMGVEALKTPRETTRAYARVYRERALGMAEAPGGPKPPPPQGHHVPLGAASRGGGRPGVRPGPRGAGGGPRSGPGVWARGRGMGAHRLGKASRRAFAGGGNPPGGAEARMALACPQAQEEPPHEARPEGKVVGQGGKEPLPEALQTGLLKEGLHVFLDAGPVHLNVASLGQKLEGHEEEAEEQGQKAAHLFEGVATA